MTTRALAHPPGLRLATALFLVFWSVLAAFPFLWIAVMSVRLPIDALSASPLNVLLGPVTRRISGGLSAVDIAVWITALVLVVRVWPMAARIVTGRGSIQGAAPRGKIAAAFAMAGVAGLVLGVGAPFGADQLSRLFAAIPGLRILAEPLIGLTFEHYRAVWITHGFTRNFWNSMIVTGGVVTISLTVGTLAGYALARARSNLAFWLLIVALIFRALPHSVLVTGYVPLFVGSRDLLAPLWEWDATGWLLRLFAAAPPTLYGQPLAVIAVLVSINQPFTIWMMRSFFQNIPPELDEAARVDGCSHFGAFRRVIMPVMWPGVITTGLFSFLLAYNDYLVTALLLDPQSQTMVPAISQFLARDTKAADEIEAIAAAVSITAPLFVLVLVFQKQIVAGLTAGAVKG